MAVITKVPEPNLWEAICKEFAKIRSPIVPDDDTASVSTDYHDFNPASHNPVFYGKMYANVKTDEDVLADFDPAISHPSCVGYSFSEKPPVPPTPPPPLPPNKNTCKPTDYLNHYVFPCLLPALEAMLQQAKIEKCFEEESMIEESHREYEDEYEALHHVENGEEEMEPEIEELHEYESSFNYEPPRRHRTKFNACDFLTEYLYKTNPNHGSEERHEMSLMDIPFVKEWLKDHPRPPLPKSLIWTDEEAVIIIQSFWRGYLVRREPDVQELRIWQHEWREENHGIKKRVSEFWGKKMPEEADITVTST